MFGAATLMLLMGVTVYILDRNANSVYFLSPFVWPNRESSVFGSIGGQLPELAHVYAFSLLTAVILGVSRRFFLASCSLWWIIDTLFELGQHPAIRPHVVPLIPPLFADIPFLENAAPYFLRGTFDPWDLIAIALGAISAYGTVRLIHQENRHHVVPH